MEKSAARIRSAEYFNIIHRVKTEERKVVAKSKECFSEFEVQAEAYFRLREHFNVRGSYRFVSESGKHCIVDLVIFNEKNEPILILEIKKSSEIRPNTEQVKRYGGAAKCPAVYICGMEEAKNIVNTAKFFISLEQFNV